MKWNKQKDASGNTYYQAIDAQDRVWEIMRGNSGSWWLIYCEEVYHDEYSYLRGAKAEAERAAGAGWCMMCVTGY